MALDDILNGEIKVLGNNTLGLRQTEKRIRAGDGPSDTGDFSEGLIYSILNYTLPEDEEITPDQINVVKSAPKEARVNSLTDHLPRAYATARTRLAGKVAPEYQEILEEFSGKYLLPILLGTPGVDTAGDFQEERATKKKFDDWNSEFENENADYYLENSHSVVKDILSENRNNDTILEYMEQRVGYQQNKFIEHFVDTEKFAKGQKNNDQELIGESVNVTKTRDYLNSTIPMLEDEDKNKSYEEIGINYSSYLVEQETIRENNSTRDRLPAAA
jgi:hypothetical protein